MCRKLFLSIARLSVMCLLLCVVGASCKRVSNKNGSFAADTLQYATWLQIERQENIKLVTIKNPWQPSTSLVRYVLVPKTDTLPDDLPKGELIRTPVERAVMHNAVHAYLAQLLGVENKVVGLCDVDYVISDDLRKRIADSLLFDAGSSVQFNMERCVSLGADALFVSPLQDVSTAGLRAIGLPIVECVDYMETHPLGRAEWMKFFGLLFECEQRADSLFAVTKEKYLSVVASVEQQNIRPRLLLDLPQGSAWYVPAGNSYLGTLMKDAGADYVFASSEGMGSMAMSRERVLNEGRSADVWLIKYASGAALTYRSLEREDLLFTTLKPWKERRIYACNTLQADYYERIPFQPHLLLSELVKLFVKDETVVADSAYFQPLQE